MRILQVHNAYQQAGGEDAVVANEGTLLTGHGHEVRLWSVSNDEIQGLWAQLRTAWQLFREFGKKARKLSYLDHMNRRFAG